MFLIAEVGVNHQGKMKKAYELTYEAKNAGADAVKFQLFNSQVLWGDDRIKQFELRFFEMEKLHSYCQQLGVEFMCSPFGVAELLLLAPLLKRVKVASGMAKRKPFLEAVADTTLPVILSTGMSTQADIHNALRTLTHDGHGDGDITLLQCTSSYPCRMEDVHLHAMRSLREEFRLPVGLSDHTTSITVPIAAAALGASVIEKHITQDRGQDGPDHKASITPKEFRAMAMALTEVEAAMGDSFKRVQPCEVELRKVWEK